MDNEVNRGASVSYPSDRAPSPSRRGALVNGATEDSQTKTSVPSVLLKPTWVTTSNMNSTVIADQFVPAQQLCVGQYATACKNAGISA